MRNGNRVGLCTVVGTLVLLLSACAENYYRHPHSGTKPLSPGRAGDADAYAQAETNRIHSGDTRDANPNQPHTHGRDCGHVMHEGRWVSVDTD